MKNVRLLLTLLTLLSVLLLPLCAQAVTTLSPQMTEVEDEAFAGTGIDALIVPAGVARVGSRVLADGSASYIYIEGADTAVEADTADDVPFVFAPAGSKASALPGFYASDTLVRQDGLYYAVTDEALPLCAVSPLTLKGSVTIPKLVAGQPVTSLNVLTLNHTGVTALHVPAYLTIPEGMNAVPYPTMWADTPVAEVSTSPAGHYVTWTTSVQGAYGAVSYLWTFTMGDETYTTITGEPSVRFAPMAEGTCTVTVTAEDDLGDRAVSAASEALTVTALERTCRAMLVGNTYPGETCALRGCDTDMLGMQQMLSTMTRSGYRISAATNLTAGEIRTGIASAFADAQPGDLSLFYFGGHGTKEGALVGVHETLLTVYALREVLDTIPGTKIVILDCCYSGQVIGRSAGADSPAAFNSAVISAFAAKSRDGGALATDGYIVLTACQKDQESKSVTDGVGAAFGAFTYGLCYGSGYDEWNRVDLGYLPADTNGDGAITLSEAVAGVKERIAYLNGLLGGQLTQNVQAYGAADAVLWQR